MLGEASTHKCELSNGEASVIKIRNWERWKLCGKYLERIVKVKEKGIWKDEREKCASRQNLGSHMHGSDALYKDCVKI